MDGKGNRNAGWMRLYQLIACAGVVLALIPATEFLALFCARQLSGVVAMLAVPVLVALGYGVQKLLLIGWRAGEMDFSFESHTEFPPLGRRIPAWGISALAGLLAGAGVRDLMAWRLGAESNSEVGGAVVMVTFAALGVAGCLMVPFRFFQMLSRRTLPGFAGVFALILGVELFLKDGGPSVTLFLSVVLWFLCFALAANQEYVIKYAYASHTCVVSARVRRAGLRNAMRVWLTAVGMFLPAAGLLTVAVTGIRMLALSGEGAPPAKLFAFPFAGAWGLNAVLFGFGVLCMVFGAGVLLYRFAHDPAKTRALLAVLSARLYDFFAGILYVFGIFVGRRRGGEPDADEVTEHYRDTVTRVRRAPQSVPCRDRRALERALRREKGNDAKFCLAYRALLAALAADGIGLTPTMTPYEAADVIRERTDMVQMDGWTAQFVSLTYAKGETHTTNADLKNLCACLYRRMQTADGGGA